MGFKTSWIGAHGVTKADMLTHFGFEDTGVEDEVNESPFSCAELPTGWTILHSNDCEWVTSKRAIKLSLHAPVLTCVLHEGVTCSESAYFVGGKRIWEIVHDGQMDGVNLSLQGETPEQFDAVKDAAFPRGLAEDGGEDDMDYAFEVPIDLAGSICGWRHDLCEFEWGVPEFTVVKVSISATQSKNPKNRSWLKQLFGG